MSLDGFRSHIRHYTQQHSLNNGPAALPILQYDGVAEVWFGDLPSAMATFTQQDYASIVAKDDENFLDRTKTMMFLSSESRIVEQLFRYMQEEL